LELYAQVLVSVLFLLWPPRQGATKNPKKRTAAKAPSKKEQARAQYFSSVDIHAKRKKKVHHASTIIKRRAPPRRPAWHSLWNSLPSAK